MKFSIPKSISPFRIDEKGYFLIKKSPKLNIQASGFSVFDM